MKINNLSLIKNILFILFAVMVLSSCATNKPAREAAVWIDVRSPTEYATGHLDNASNIPFQEIGQRITEVARSKNEKIYVYCASGGRAEIARKTLVGLGYTDVTNAGGYRDLVKKENEGQSKN